MSSLEYEVLRTCQQLGVPTAEEIMGAISESGQKTTVSQIIDALLREELAGAVKRVQDERFDRLRPLTSVGWRVTVVPPAPATTPTAQKEVRPPSESGYAGNVRLVFSQPSFAYSAIEDLKKTTGAMELREAMEFVILSAKRSLRVMSYNYDIMFADMLSRYTSQIKSIPTLMLVADEDRDATRQALTKIMGLFPQARVKYFYRSSPLQRSKTGGVHAKMILADDTRALLGSFNLSSSHTMLNFDAGILLEGAVVRDLVSAYDTIWDLG